MVHDPNYRSCGGVLSKNKESSELVTIRLIYLSNKHITTYNEHTKKKHKIIGGLTYNNQRPPMGVVVEISLLK